MQSIRASFRRAGDSLLANAVPHCVKTAMTRLVAESTRSVKNMASATQRLVVRLIDGPEPIVMDPWPLAERSLLRNTIQTEIRHLSKRLTAAGLNGFRDFHKHNPLSAADRSAISTGEISRPNLSQNGKLHILTYLLDLMESEIWDMPIQHNQLDAAVFKCLGIAKQMDELMGDMEATNDLTAFKDIFNQSPLKSLLHAGMDDWSHAWVRE